MITFFLLLNDAFDLGVIFLPSIPFRDPIKDFLGMINFIVVHQDVRWLLQEEVEHDEQDTERHELEDEHEVEPVQS